ncbi:MAG: HAMP domain-containing sensor histidine kinase [Bacteroidales bacterium]
MMSIIAHDLRGTMGNLLTAIDVLHLWKGRTPLRLTEKSLLWNLRQSASYSLELLENLLHWSRLEENEAYFQPEPVQLDKLIRNCVNLFEESARLKEVTIREDMQTGIQCQVDQVMMETIVRNLISNALKFSHPGGAIIIHGASSNGLIHLSVADQGIGITEDQIRKITRNGGYTRKGTANEKGAGIGLTLVREFAARHKGELLIHSHPGQGSTFEIQFPCSS